MIDFEDLNPINSKSPATIASATVIEPKNRFTIITGHVPIQIIVPPVEFYHELVFYCEDSATFPCVFGILGNILTPLGIDYQIEGLLGCSLYYHPSKRKYILGSGFSAA